VLRGNKGKLKGHARDRGRSGQIVYTERTQQGRLACASGRKELHPSIHQSIHPPKTQRPTPQFTIYSGA
jgi:hypothetical protein